MNGCYNREPMQNMAEVQDGWHYKNFGYPKIRTAVIIEIKVPMTKTCQYQKLKKDDPKCLGCRELE